MEFLRTLAGSEHYQWGEGCDGWHLVRNNELSVIYECMPAGTKEVRHRHERTEQFFFVLKGTAVLEIEGKEIELKAEQGAHVPPGAAHQFFNRSNEELRFLVVSRPPSHGDRMEA